MAVKVGNLWKDTKFQSLGDQAKLLYIYLATQPSISTLGVVLLNMQIVGIELSKTLDELRDAATELLKKDYIIVHNSPEGVYFVVLDHFQTLPKSELIVKKANKEITQLPKRIGEMLNDYIDISQKFISFTEPTEQEIIDFAISKGFLIDAKEFIRFYKDIGANLGKDGWYDSRGRQVKNWRGKLTKVWFPKATKLEACKDAPKGFEYFHINIGGKIVTPDSWRNGLPYSKQGIVYDKKLQEEYARKRGSQGLLPL